MRFKTIAIICIFGAFAGAGASAMQQQPAPTGQTPPNAPVRGPMSFFVTSETIGNGGNLGGLAGADALCQRLGTAAGRGNVTWHAYLSTQGAGAVNARDRIGKGPWFNFKGIQIAKSLSNLHGDTLEEAQLGMMLGGPTGLTDKGEEVKGFGIGPNNTHDILTGSTVTGRAFAPGQDRTCSNWTSNAEGQGTAMLGHVDKVGGGNGSWNSSHPSRGCSQKNLVETGGNGRLYCFAVN